MESEILAKIPEWYNQLSSGGILPPEPSGGWGRWWGDWSGQLWFLIIVFGMQAALLLFEHFMKKVSHAQYS